MMWTVSFMSMMADGKCRYSQLHFLLRLMQLRGEPLEDIPQGMYQGEYITGIARLWQESQGGGTTVTTFAAYRCGYITNRAR